MFTSNRIADSNIHEFYSGYTRLGMWELQKMSRKNGQAKM